MTAAGGDERLAAPCREVLGQHPPSPLGGGSSNTATGEWTRQVNEVTVASFRAVASIEDYLAAQERITSSDPYRRSGWPSRPPVNPLAGRIVPTVAPEDTATPSTRTELFVIMPFSESWSDSTYAFIRRVVERLDASDRMVHLYRADDLAEPGQITQQIKDSIRRAHLTITDITNVNPNVMWELGYADGLGRTIVILNQNPGSSPFDMVDRRQVGYQADPNADDEDNLLRHIIEALRTGHGISVYDRGTA